MKEVLAMIKVKAEKHGIVPAVLYGICKQESGLDPHATRSEPHYRWIVRDTRLKPHNCTIITEHALQRISWGVMQVMGAVIREQGYAGWIDAIACDLDAQIEYGCRHLKKMIQRYGEMEGVLAYNAGSPRKGPDGNYVNAYYYARVMRYASDYAALGPG
jgi:hypothetical protein